MFWIGAILALSVLIIVHESGHYIVAKWCKMRVDRFSVGFGPTLLGWRRKGTLFQVAPIPFGGFVEIRGMNIAEDVDPDDEHAYPNRPAWQRFLTIFAGPGTNYLFAIFLAFIYFNAAGAPTDVDKTYWITEVTEGFDAHGKLEAGDRIVSVKVAGATEVPPLGQPGFKVSEIVQSSGGEPLEVVVEREGKALPPFTITPQKGADVEAGDKSGAGDKAGAGDEAAASDEAEAGDTSDKGTALGEVDGDQYLIGIRMNVEKERRPVGLLEAAGHALYYPIETTGWYLGVLRGIFSGDVEGQITGPVGITTVVKTALEDGWLTALQLLMVLNILLAIVNLFPLPALDGGRLVFLTYEMATRRRANPKVEASVHMVGIMVLLLVLVVVTVKECGELAGAW